MGAIDKYKSQLAARSKQISDLRNGSVPQAIGAAAIVDGAAFAAGFVDTKVGDIGGMKPSIVAGVAAATAGVILKSPKAIQAASGLLAPVAYNAGVQAAEAMDGDE